MWIVLTLVVIAAGAALLLQHKSWQRKLSAAEAARKDEIQSLKRHETEAAHKLQAEQEALFNSMIEGVLVLDEAGRIRLANRAFSQLFGGQTHLRGKTLIEAFRSHEISDLVERLGGQGSVLDYEMKLPGLEERWLQVNAASIGGNGGKGHGTIVVFHDLTRLKQLERTREEFVANVSHELRTPLSMIKGYVETLLEGARNDPEVAEKFLRTVDRNARRLDALIQDLLAISELESGRVKLTLGTVSLGSVVEKVFTDLKTRALAKDVKLRDESGDLNVTADEGRLQQVLTNLVDNAIKYGRTGGTVVIGGREIKGDKVELTVRDDGPGIPADALERVFERFYRVDKARSRDQGGTGLGLSIVKHIVQSHGGTVWATSEPGRGTAFYFTLPKGLGGAQQELIGVTGG
ncbi:MAG TPA: ATP-binding protein [Verrucomicrobiota bacterium]|nr:ATP-binding protein [Verrucomicrobiota bacterium]